MSWVILGTIPKSGIADLLSMHTCFFCCFFFPPLDIARCFSNWLCQFIFSLEYFIVPISGRPQPISGTAMLGILFSSVDYEMLSLSPVPECFLSIWVWQGPYEANTKSLDEASVLWRLLPLSHEVLDSPELNAIVTA